jgi:alkylhydroperoxidase family enzyme
MTDPTLPPPRIAPLQPPYAPELDALLKKMSPPQAPSILALFRVLAHHPALAEAMTGLGRVLLGRQSLLPLRAREVVIDRVCARCGAEYEWGVHVAAFAEAAGLDAAQNAAIANPDADDTALTAGDRLLVQLVDELHDSGTASDALWAELAAQWTPPQLIELLVLAGWYHAISYVCTGARVPLEPWARAGSVKVAASQEASRWPGS